MIRDELWEEAEVLAARPYRAVFFKESLTDGSSVVMVRSPELSGCLAHGTTKEEATRELEEARKVYIYSLLEDGLPVPEPEIVATSVSRYPSAELLFTVRAEKNSRWVNTRSTSGDFLPILVKGSPQSVPA